MAQNSPKIPKKTPKKTSVQLSNAEVPAGFPSPAQDYSNVKIDLNEHLIKDPTSTYILRIKGDSMIGIGIYDGDEIIVDRSLPAQNNSIVVAIIDNEFCVKRLLIEGQKEDGTFEYAVLKSENPKYKPIIIEENSELRVWGVVTKTLHTPR